MKHTGATSRYPAIGTIGITEEFTGYLGINHFRKPSAI